jgi:hypothetical protein
MGIERLQIRKIGDHIMARQFIPPPEAKGPASKEEALLSPVNQAIQTIPSLYAQYKLQRLQEDLALKKHKMEQQEHDSKFGTGKYENIQPGALTSSPRPGASPEEEILGFEATPPTFTEEAPDQQLRRMGSEGFNALTARTKAEKEAPGRSQLKVTDKNVPVLFDPVSNTLMVQATGEVYDPSIHGNIVVPGAPPILPPNQNVEITDITAARKQLRDLVSGADASGFGKGNPYIEKARTSPLNPFQLLDPKAQKFKQLTAATKQVIGKGLEGGVLRKEDEAKYDAIIPKSGDTDEILKIKAQQLDSLLEQKQKERVKGFSSAGFRGVPGSDPMPPIQQDQGGLPTIGGTFQGGKVLKVRRIE